MSIYDAFKIISKQPFHNIYVYKCACFLTFIIKNNNAKSAGSCIVTVWKKIDAPMYVNLT